MSQASVTFVHMFDTARVAARPPSPTWGAGSRHLGVVARERPAAYAAGEGPEPPADAAGRLTGELSRLHGELVAVAAGVPERAATDEVDALFAAFRRVEGAVASVRAKLVRCAQVSRAPEKGGHDGGPSYLKQQLGLSGRDAAKQDKLARDLDRLPGTAAALAAGELGADQAAAIGQAARRGALGDPERTEEQLLDIARSTDVDGLRRRIRVEEQRADRQRLARDEQLAYSRRRASLSRRGDGMWDLHAQLTGEQGELLAVALDAYRTKDAAEVPIPQQRSFEQRTADALAAVVAGAMDGGGSASQGGARPQLHIVLPHDVLDAAGTGVARTERGGPLSPVLVERLLCDAQMRRVVTDGASEVLDIGRSSEKWTVGQRRALHVRDGGCRGPGCDRPATSCHAHHVRWWSKGGSTAVSNGLLLCSYHHHLVHEGGWGLKVDGRTGRATFIAPGGRELVTLPKGLPLTVPGGAADRGTDGGEDRSPPRSAREGGVDQRELPGGVDQRELPGGVDQRELPGGVEQDELGGGVEQHQLRLDDAGLDDAGRAPP